MTPIYHGPLHHYTSQAGILGICSYQSFWATDIRYLNDSREYEYGSHLISGHLAKLVKSSLPLVKETFQNGCLPDIFSDRNIFVTSFSEQGDLLSQWRAYTPSNAGFSLGFTFPSHLYTSSSNLSLKKVIYSPNQQIEQIDALAHELNESYLKEIELAATVQDQRAIREKWSVLLCLRLSLLIPTFKHPSFSEEQEWRFILLQRQSDRVQFRLGQSFLVPYVEVTQAMLIDGSASPPPDILPLTEVIVGPCPHPILALKATQMLLRQQGFTANVSSTSTPFRSW